MIHMGGRQTSGPPLGPLNIILRTQKGTTNFDNYPYHHQYLVWQSFRSSNRQPGVGLKVFLAMVCGQASD